MSLIDILDGRTPKELSSMFPHIDPREIEEIRNNSPYRAYLTQPSGGIIVLEKTYFNDDPYINLQSGHVLLVSYDDHAFTDHHALKEAFLYASIPIITRVHEGRNLEGFKYLKTIEGKPGNLPITTGATGARILGAIHQA